MRSSRALASTLVLNADDPLIADLGRERDDTIYFGIEDPAAATAAGLSHASDSKHCRRCGAAYRYAHVYIAHLGDYGCPGCGRAVRRRRSAPTRSHSTVCAGASFELRTPSGSGRA